MHDNHALAFDATALRNSYIARHGRDIGALVYDAEMSRRRALDERHAELTAEHAATMRALSERQAVAGQTQATWQAKIEAAFAPYQALLEAAAADDVTAQSEVAVLFEKCRALQAAMRAIATPRLSERELQAVAIYNSPAATLARESNVKLAPLAEPMSVLAKINFDGKRK